MKHCPECNRQWHVDGKQLCPYCCVSLVSDPPEISTNKAELADVIRSVEFIVTVCQHERSKLKPSGLDGHLNAIEGTAKETLTTLRRLSK